MSCMPSEILAQLLIDRGIAVDPDDAGIDTWPVTWGPPLVDQNNCIFLSNYGADLMGRTYPRGERSYKPRVQVKIRSLGDDLGYYKGQEIETLSERLGIAYEHDGIGHMVVTVVKDDLTEESFGMLSLGLITATAFISREMDNPLRALHTLNVRMSYNKL